MCFALFFLDLKSRLAILFLHTMCMYLASFSFLVHVMWELFIIFDHMILILKSHAFDCKD